MSSEDLEPKPIRRTNSGNIIVYYPETDKLEKIKFDNEKGKSFVYPKKSHRRILTVSSARNLTWRCKAPKVRSRARIYAREKENNSLLLASIKLSNLGWQTSIQRMCGKCNDIYTPKAVAARAA